MPDAHDRQAREKCWGWIKNKNMFCCSFCRDCGRSVTIGGFPRETGFAGKADMVYYCGTVALGNHGIEISFFFSPSIRAHVDAVLICTLPTELDGGLAMGLSAFRSSLFPWGMFWAGMVEQNSVPPNWYARTLFSWPF